MKNVIVSVLCLALFYPASAAREWALKKQNGDLKVYTAPVPNSPCKAVRVQCTVNGKFSQVIASLCDLPRQKEWVYNIKSSTLLKKVQENELIYHSEVSVPWPCANRDFIAHLKIEQPSTSVVTITTKGESSYIPEKEGVVRVKTSSALWTMTALGNNKIAVDYVVQFDPAGDVPSWLINMFVTKGPYETFDKLQQRIDMPEYKAAHYDFIKE